MFITELRNMFWGVTLDGGKRYTQTVERSFHLSMAALEPGKVSEKKKSDSSVSVMIQHEKAEFMLCTLEQGKVYQQPLDLNFTEGEEVTFFLSNNCGIVHLTGFLIEEDQYGPDDISAEDFMDAPSSEEDSEDDEVPTLIGGQGDFEGKGKKRKKGKEMVKKGKKLKMIDSDDDDEDEDDDEEDDDEPDLADFIDDEAIGDSDDEEEEEEDDDDDEILVPKKKKKEKVEQEVQTPKPKQPEVVEQEEGKKKKKKKKKKKNKDTNEQTNSTESPKQQQKQPKKQVIAGGVVSEELKVGHGPQATPGKMVHVYYTGILQKSGQQFDSCKQGKPFRFRLGKGEVIKGWDSGVNGMKVGGKRKLVIPPQQGYGNTKQGPIPPGSTLVFEVELKAVS